MKTFFSALVLAALCVASSDSQGQTGTIKLIVGYPPGATSDTLTRVIADAMAKRLNQPVVVENRTGAGGQVGNQAVKAAPPDGTTLLLTPVATMSIFPHSFAGQLKYDPFKDFAPVAHVSNFQLGFGVAASVPAQTLSQYVAWVKSNPSANGFYGSASAGTIPHFFGVMFAKSAGITLSHVPYRGTAPAMQALAGGEISALSTVAADIQSLVKSERARLLAVAGEKRSAQFPNVPTFKEQGYDLVAAPWYGIFAPAGTPRAIIDRLANAVMESIKDPAVAQRIIDMSLEPTGFGPDRLGDIMRTDFERWAAPIRESGFKPD